MPIGQHGQSGRIFLNKWEIISPNTITENKNVRFENYFDSNKFITMNHFQMPFLLTIINQYNECMQNTVNGLWKVFVL